MGHLTLYRADMTPAAWETERFSSGLGRLPDAREPRTHRVVNGDWSFTMLYPLNGMNASEIVQDRLICAEGQLYRINGIQKEDVGSGRMLRVDAEHIFYDLRDSEIVNIETAENPDTENGVTQEEALGRILAGTPFSVGTVNTGSSLNHLDILQKSPYWALKEQVLTLWGGELFPDNWTIHILSQCGLDRKFPIRRGRNLKGIKYKESTKETVTRLHVTGYDGATFEEIYDGRDYIDSPNIGLYHAPKEGRVSFDDIDDPTELLTEAQAYLPTVDNPQVEYDLDLLFLKRSAFWSLYAPLEECDLGDTVSIHHDFFALDIPARTMEAERDPVREFTVRVVIGNYTNKLFSTLSEAKATADLLSIVAGADGTLKAGRLRGMIDLLTTRLKSSGSYANASVLEDQGFLIENTNASSPDYGAMYLGCGIFAIAGEKNEDNSWRWNTFGTPLGFTGQMILAESITANKLAADVANSLELSSNESILAVVSAAVEAESNALKAYAQELLTDHDWTVEINQAQAAAIELSDTELETFKSWVKGWMSYDGTTLSLGKSDSDYATAITNTQMAFTYKGTTLAYFSNGMLHVPWAEFEKVTMTQKSSAGAVEGYLDIALENGSYYGAWRDA